MADTKNMTLRLPVDLHASLKGRAEAKGVSMHEYLLYCLRLTEELHEKAVDLGEALKERREAEARGEAMPRVLREEEGGAWVNGVYYPPGAVVTTEGPPEGVKVETVSVKAASNLRSPITPPFREIVPEEWQPRDFSKEAQARGKTKATPKG